MQPSGSVTYQNNTNAILFVTYRGCDQQIHVNFGINADHHYRIYTDVQVSCGWTTEAGATCQNRYGQSKNIWGLPGTKSYAPCNSTYYFFYHGGARVKVGRTWYYWTYIFPRT